jgi:hypothetical protein
MIAGVALWALPAATPVVGRPPIVVGWVCVILGGLIVILATANFVREYEFQPPIRHKVAVNPAEQSQAVAPAAPLPVPQASQPTAPPIPTPQPVRPTVRPGQRREFTDATPRDLVKLANTPGLTKVQVSRLLEPHIGKWLAIEGIVDDVSGSSSWAGLNLIDVNGDHTLKAKAYFNKKDGAQAYERATALHRGARLRVQGKIDGVAGWGHITLDPCEFVE